MKVTVRISLFKVYLGHNAIFLWYIGVQFCAFRTKMKGKGAILHLFFQVLLAQISHAKMAI